MTYLPLDGIKVLDLTRMIPGDLATRKLADLGADVVKVEEPNRGDYLRSLPPYYDGQGLTFIGLNRNKRSIELDIRAPEGLELFHRLAAVADVIVEVSHPGRWLQLGIDFAALRRERPELIVCSISGFGQTGPLAQLPSHGLTMDALVGLAPIVDTPEGGKRISIQVGTTLSGELGAMNAALAVMAALVNVRGGGDGVWIDASMWDAGAELHRGAMVRAGIQADDDTASTPARDFNDNTLYAIYECAEHTFLLIAAIEQKFFTALCVGIDREDLLGQWDAGARGIMDFGRPELRPELEQVFRKERAEVWFDRFVEWDVPGALILSGADLREFPHTLARGLIESGWNGSLDGVLDPIRWLDVDGGSRPGMQARLPPTIGQDTDDVIREMAPRR